MDEMERMVHGIIKEDKIRDFELNDDILYLYDLKIFRRVKIKGTFYIAFTYFFSNEFI